MDTTVPRRVPPYFVEGYSEEDYRHDLDLLNRFLISSALLRKDISGTLLFDLRSASECREPDAGSPPP